MTYADSDDVLSRWVGQGKPADSTQVDTLCGDAEAIIAGEFPDLAARITAGSPTAEQVKLVVVAMVTRVYKNPERVRSKNDSTSDQFGGSVVFSGDNPGALELTKAERALLSAPRSSNVTGLSSIQLAAPAGTNASRLVYGYWDEDDE